MVVFRITGGELQPEIEVPAEATFLDLKDLIQSRLDIKVSRQMLMFNDKELRDDQIIAQLGVDFAPLLLVVAPLSGQPKFCIIVESSIKDFIVKVRETYTVSHLKMKIQKQSGILFNNMRLYRLSEEMDDDLPLSAYYVCHGSKVEMIYGLDPR